MALLIGSTTETMKIQCLGQVWEHQRACLVSLLRQVLALPWFAARLSVNHRYGTTGCYCFDWGMAVVKRYVIGNCVSDVLPSWFHELGPETAPPELAGLELDFVDLAEWEGCEMIHDWRGKAMLNVVT